MYILSSFGRKANSLQGLKLFRALMEVPEPNEAPNSGKLRLARRSRRKLGRDAGSTGHSFDI
jgi:hypothetical protein